MKLRAKLTAAEFAELRSMSRSWAHWLHLILRNHVAIFLAVAMLCSTAAAAVYHHEDISWPALTAVWLVIGAFAAWATRKQRAANAVALARLNARLPEFFVVASDGIRYESLDNAPTNLPWTSFKSWREGRLIFLLQARGTQVCSLPKGDLAPHDVELLRGQLTSFLAAASLRYPGTTLSP